MAKNFFEMVETNLWPRLILNSRERKLPSTVNSPISDFTLNFLPPKRFNFRLKNRIHRRRHFSDAFDSLDFGEDAIVLTNFVFRQTQRIEDMLD